MWNPIFLNFSIFKNLLQHAEKTWCTALLTIPTTSVFAPSVSRDSTISRYPFLQAQIKGVVPYCNTNQNLIIYNSGNIYIKEYTMQEFSQMDL